MFFTKRGIIALAVCFIVMFLGGNSLAADSKSNEPKRGEVYLGIGTIIDGRAIAGIISAGWYLTNSVELEANAIFVPGDAVISGNISFNLPMEAERVILFGTIGLGSCIHKVLFVNVGGGLKIRIKDKLHIRAEFRHYRAEDARGSGIVGGISYVF